MLGYIDQSRHAIRGLIRPVLRYLARPLFTLRCRPLKVACLEYPVWFLAEDQLADSWNVDHGYSVADGPLGRWEAGNDLGCRAHPASHTLKDGPFYRFFSAKI